ncbi:MAG: hypothetical protein KAV43_03885 [Hadesarchaea archaeon]|nr:hypothetical protein [Hadesarchaea archaeon]
MGRRSKLGAKARRFLRRDVYAVCREYDVLTLRQVYYRLIARHDYYPPTLVFYKYLSRHLTRWRKVDEWLDDRFVDPSRPFIQPPRPWKEGELWLEKDSLRALLEKLAMRYRVPIVVQRGFASRSMLRDAFRRARERGVRKIFLVLDFDPSGLCIEAVNEREMGIKMSRVALTYEQAKGLPFRLVKRRDTRAKKYMAKYGDRCWEVEALEPRQLLQIVEQTLRREVPPEHLREAGLEEEAAKVALEILEPIRMKIAAAASELLRRGVPPDRVRERLGRKLAF